MLLEELGIGSRVTILVGIGGQTLSFDSEVEELSEGGVLTTPVYRNDKLVGFRAKGLVIRIQVYNVDDKKIYEFTDVTILNVKTPDEKIHHKMVSKTPGKQINRRTAVRVWLGLDGIVQVGMNKVMYEVLVKDISISGISFVFHKDLNVDPGTIVQVMFNDVEVRSKFVVNAIIVRKEELAEGKVLYGCRMNQESQAIAKYINDKQREKLKGSRTVGTTVPLEAKE